MVLHILLVFSTKLILFLYFYLLHVLFVVILLGPPTYDQVHHWPGEGVSTTTAGSDTEVKGPDLLKVINSPDPPKSILYDRNSPRGSPRVPDLPPKPEVRFDLSHQSGRSPSSQSSPRGQTGSQQGSRQSTPDPIKTADIDLNVYGSLPKTALAPGTFDYDAPSNF